VIVALCVAGGLATVIGWRIAATRGASVWLTMGVVNGVIGALALATGRVTAASRVDPWVALGVGIASGCALYGATVAFVLVARRWPVFDRHVAEIYSLGGGLSVPVAVLLVAAIYAPGEEVFWRGLVQGRFAAAWSTGWGAAAAWLAYVAAETASGSLAVVVAAVVAGGAWTALAVWTGGVIAAAACHVVWTGAMVVWPPGGASRRTTTEAGRAAPAS
jgi:membrane protease YdiL (CAAX protease family)